MVSKVHLIISPEGIKKLLEHNFMTWTSMQSHISFYVDPTFTGVMATSQHTIIKLDAIT
jgi:hypothetical protein